MAQSFCRTVPVHNCPDGIPWHGANRLYQLPMKRAARSAIMIVGAFVLPLTIVGITDASATRNPTMSWTLRSGLTGSVIIIHHARFDRRYSSPRKKRLCFSRILCRMYSEQCATSCDGFAEAHIVKVACQN